VAYVSAGAQRSYKIALPIALFIWLLPLIAVLLTSIRSAGDINSGNFWGMPTSFNMIENYTAVFTNTEIGKYIWNSFRVTIPTVFLTLFLSCLSGYALAIYRFKASMWHDTVTGLVLFHAAFQAGFCTLFMRNFIKALPFELIESARVEGVGEFKIFWHIVMPLMRPAIAALAVLIFTFIWNDYFWATVLVQGDHALPITAGLKTLNGQWISQWHLVSAGAIMAALPPVLMFFAMQKHFIAGLTLGATKG